MTDPHLLGVMLTDFNKSLIIYPLLYLSFNGFLIISILDLPKVSISFKVILSGPGDIPIFSLKHFFSYDFWIDD